MNTNYNYINLILAMKLNRGDWSEGYTYVRNALKSFKIETDFDRLVYEELKSIVENDEYPDGRSFRDCTYNYDYLYEHVLNEKEKKELNKLLEMAWDKI